MKKKTQIQLSILGCIIILVVFIIGRYDNYFENQQTYDENVENKITFYPTLWMDHQRMYPHNTINYKNQKEAFRKANEMHQTANRNASTYNLPEWNLKGPTNIGGRIVDVAVHPSNLNTIYIAAATGGVWKTTDGGSSWNSISQEIPFVSIGDVTIDPNNPDIVYVGTGEANNHSFSILGGGMYKSTNAGQNWFHIGLDNTAYIARTIVDYNNSQIIYAATSGNKYSPSNGRGVYKSIDGGQSWDQVLFLGENFSAIDLVQDSEDPEILYASMWDRASNMQGTGYVFSEETGIFKTIDGGENWLELTNGLPVNSLVGRIGIDLCKSNPSIVYAFYDMPDGKPRVYKSTDKGENWNLVASDNLLNMNMDFGWYFGQIRVDPSNQNRVYVMGVEMHRTEDGGSTWQKIASYDNNDEIHVDHHAMYIDENTGKIFVGNDGGFYTSDNYGDDWIKPTNPPITQFYDIAVDYQDPNRLYGGTQDNGSNRTLTGSLDDWDLFLGGDGMYNLVDYTNSNYYYAAYQYGRLIRFNDELGLIQDINWNMIADRKNWVTPVVMDPVDPKILYYGAHRMWKTYDRGDNFDPISEDLTDGWLGGMSSNTITTIAVSVVNNQLVACGTDDGHVHISQDAGATWTEITNGLPDRWITRVAFDPFEENTLYVTVSGFKWAEPAPHVFKSSDLGQNWENISSNLPEIPVNVIVCDPIQQDRLYIGTDAGVFFTEDAGQEWYSLMNGLLPAYVMAMEIHEPSYTLYIGTHGLSIYSMDLSGLTVGVDELKQNKMEFSCYPNPVKTGNPVTIKINSKIGDHLRIQIVDFNGRVVNELFNGISNNVKNTFNWYSKDSRGNTLKPGIYFCRIALNGSVQSNKIIVN